MCQRWKDIPQNRKPFGEKCFVPFQMAATSEVKFCFESHLSVFFIYLFFFLWGGGGGGGGAEKKKKESK